AKEKVQTVGIIGTGAQARYQLKALKLVRNFEKVLVYGRTPDNAKKLLADVKDKLDAHIQITEEAETVVRNSDIVVTTTPATEPLIKADWLHPGLHITAMGSDAEEKQELEADVLKKADRFVCDTRAQCARLGELHHSIEQGFISEDASIIELGEVTSGKKAGRVCEQEITVCDLTGTGVQDTAIALQAFKLLTEKEGIGLQIDNKKSFHFT
ncbi:ornithine cyclodeaminase family protein, partial [Butyricicoccus sp. 1XD8-22]